MGFSYGRVDFLPPSARCCFCNRPLRSAKGIVVIDPTGEEFFAGPSCAKRELGPPDERILDVARLALLVVVDEKPEKPALQVQPNPVVDSPLPPPLATTLQTPPPGIDPAIQYLRLRYEVMGRFKHHVSKAMREAYANYQALGELDAESHRMLTMLMRKAASDNATNSDRNIRRCIGIEHWLFVAMEQTKPDKRGFLQAMLDKLHSNWMLRPGQISAINKWGEGIRRVAHDFPVLDVAAFDGVTMPEFMQRRRQSQA